MFAKFAFVTGLETGFHAKACFKPVTVTGNGWHGPAPAMTLLRHGMTVGGGRSSS